MTAGCHIPKYVAKLFDQRFSVLCVELAAVVAEDFLELFCDFARFAVQAEDGIGQVTCTAPWVGGGGAGGSGGVWKAERGIILSGQAPVSSLVRWGGGA